MTLLELEKEAKQRKLEKLAISLQELRKDMSWANIQEVAQISGYSETTVYNYLKGHPYDVQTATNIIQVCRENIMKREQALAK